MASRRFSIEAIFEARDRWTGKLQKMSGSVGKFNQKLTDNIARTRKFGKGWDDATEPIKNGARAVGRASVVAGVAGAAALRSVIKEGAEFEQTMVGAATKFGDAADVGTAVFAQLEAEAMRVGATTEHSGAQAAGALKFMAMAGEDAATAQGVLGDAANFATAGEVELARATDIMSDALGPLGVKLKEGETKVDAYRKTMDLMTFATSKGNMGLEEMFEATKIGAAGFRGAGQSAEMFAASATVLSNAGIKGSKAGKDLQRMMISLTAPTEKAAKLMEEIEFSPVNKDGTIKAFDEIMREMKAKTAAMTDEKRAQFLAEVIGKNSMASALAVMENVDAVTKLAAEAENATGITAKQADKMRNTTEGMLKSVDSTLSSIKLDIFKEIEGDVKEIGAAAIAWGRANKGAISAGFRKGVKWLRDNFEDIVKWGGRMVKLVGIFMAIDTSVKAIRTTMMAWQFAKHAVSGLSKVAGALGEVTRGMRVAGSQANALNTKFGTMDGRARGLGAAIAIAGAAFAGWKIGQWLNDTFKADERLAALLARVTGLNAELQRADNLNKRKIAGSEAEIIERKKKDIAELQGLIDQGGFFDTMSGTTEERIREMTRLRTELAQLEAKKSLERRGFDTGDADVMRAANALRAQRKELSIAQMRGADDDTLERMRENVTTFEARLDALRGLPPAAQAANDAVAAAVVDTQADPRLMGAPGAGAAAANERLKVGATPPPPPLPEKGMSREQLEQMLLQQAQMIAELQKSNTRRDRLDINVTTAAGLDAEGQSTAGAVTVQRTGSGV